MPWHFAAENGEQDFKNPAPLPSAPLYGKIGFTTVAVIVSLCGATRPAPPTSPKEQKISFHPLTIAVLECKVIQIHEIGSHIQFIGEIENVKVDDTFDDKTPLIEQLRPIVYGAGDNFTYYGLGKKIHVQQDGMSLKESIEKVSK